jgi:inosine/xanthosine triphosphatase
MYFFLGSTNPIKFNAVKIATQDRWPKATIKGFEVDSQVSSQPRTDQETKQGAINRAQAALDQGISKTGSENIRDDQHCLGVGLEGGVMIIDDDMWTTVWGVVIDVNHNLFQARGGHFPVPDFVAERILAGEEMGLIMSSFFNGRSVKTQEGLVGVMTGNFVDRTQLYSAIIKLAIGQWSGRDWREKLSI